MVSFETLYTVFLFAFHGRICSCLDTIHESDRRTDTTRRHRPRLYIASRAKTTVYTPLKGDITRTKLQNITKGDITTTTSHKLLFIEYATNAAQ